MRERMDELAAEITASLLANPDDFDSREHLWQEREDLRAKLVASEALVEA